MRKRHISEDYRVPGIRINWKRINKLRKVKMEKKDTPNPNLDRLKAVSKVFVEIISMAGGQLICVACSEGHEANELDEDGVLSSVSGKPGIWCHSYEDAYWPCIDRNLSTIATDLLRLAEENDKAYHEGYDQGVTGQPRRKRLTAASAEKEEG